MSEIPTAFGGFAPFPNTIMIPTMGLQSDVIGFRFGFGYEKGKRTLRAMSNEQFNNLDEAAEQAIYKHHEATAINFFKLEIQNWTNLQQIIIEKSVEIEKMKANRTPSAFREIFEGFTSGFGDQQKQDASNFFSSINNTIMNLIGFFSGGKQQTQGPPAPLPNTQQQHETIQKDLQKNKQKTDKEIFEDPYDSACHRNGISKAEYTSETNVMNLHLKLMGFILQGRTRDIPSFTRLRDLAQAKHKAAYGHFVNTKCAETEARRRWGN